MDPLELAEVAEYLAGRADRLTGAGFAQIRAALKLSEHEAAVELETTEREIFSIEGEREAVIPERLDHRIRKLYLSPRR